MKADDKVTAEKHGLKAKIESCAKMQKIREREN